MYPPIIDRENVLARQNEILQAAEQYRQAKKLGETRTFHWPKLGNLFSARKIEKQTAVISQSSVTQS